LPIADLKLALAIGNLQLTMVSFALQITPDDPLFWIMVIIAVSFVVMAIAMVAIAVFVSRAVRAVDRLEHKMEPLIERVSVISDQGKLIAVQAKQISEQFSAMSGHLANATMYFSDSLAIIKGEVAELKELVSDTAVEARDKVELVSRTIDRTQQQVVMTTDFIQSRVIEPARELAAIMAGFRRGLEVLVAPVPKPINQTYAEDEMFIG
jgi:methyl-accepting chemotaxis protein